MDRIREAEILQRDKQILEIRIDELQCALAGKGMKVRKSSILTEEKYIQCLMRLIASGESIKTGQVVVVVSDNYHVVAGAVYVDYQAPAQEIFSYLRGD